MHDRLIGEELLRRTMPATLARVHGHSHPHVPIDSPLLTRPVANRLLIVGDSLAIGAAEVVGSQAVRFVEPAYPEVMRDLLPGVNIIVDSGINRVTQTVVERIDDLLRTHRPSVLLIGVGGNDADCDWRRFLMSDGTVVRSRVKVETYRENLHRIIRHAAAAGTRSILTEPSNQYLGLRIPYLTKLSKRDVGSMIAANGGQKESDRRLMEYRQAVNSVAAETGTPLVHCPVDISDHDPFKILCEDGTHLSAHAHRLLAIAFTAAVKRLLAPLHVV